MKWSYRLELWFLGLDWLGKLSAVCSVALIVSALFFMLFLLEVI